MSDREWDSFMAELENEYSNNTSFILFIGLGLQYFHYNAHYGNDRTGSPESPNKEDNKDGNLRELHDLDCLQIAYSTFECLQLVLLMLRKPYPCIDFSKAMAGDDPPLNRAIPRDSFL
jgi:hypothetical protein